METLLKIRAKLEKVLEGEALLAANNAIAEELIQSKDVVVRYTDAPTAYDGFGTFTFEMMEKKTNRGQFRAVMILKEHLLWQESRYGSGMFVSLNYNKYFEWKG